MSLALSGKSLASSYIAAKTRTFNDKLDFISVIFSIWMCYYAWVNIYQYQYKPNDYEIYKEHFLVRVPDIDIKYLQQQCQYFPTLDIQSMKIINRDDENVDFLSITVTYSTTTKIISILMVILNFLTFFFGTFNPLWSLRTFVAVYFIDMAYTVQAPLITNVNYGQKCLQTSPLLNYISPKFLPATAGNMWVMVIVLFMFLLIFLILNIIQNNPKSCHCNNNKVKNILIVVILSVNIFFFLYCLFYYITSFWANTFLGNLIWFLNTILDYISYCNTVQDLKQQQRANQLHQRAYSEFSSQSMFFAVSSIEQ